MDYTEEQLAMLQRLKSGVLYEDLNEEEREILRFLDQSGLAQPRADIQDGFYTISQNGLRVLSTWQTSVQQLQYERSKDAEQKKQWDSENKLAILNLLISLVSFFVGVCVDFHFSLYEKISQLFQRILSLF